MFWIYHLLKKNLLLFRKYSIVEYSGSVFMLVRREDSNKFKSSTERKEAM
jgi:hypothetical protein